MNETKVFEKTLDNGVVYEIHEAKGFSDRVELAIKVEGVVASIIEIEIKRTGNVVCKPSMAKRIFIDRGKKINKPKAPLSLSDVLDVDDNEPEIDQGESVSQ